MELEELLEQEIERYGKVVAHLQNALSVLQELGDTPIKGSVKKRGRKKASSSPRKLRKRPKKVSRVTTAFRLEDDEEEDPGFYTPRKKSHRSKKEIERVRQRLLNHFKRTKSKPQRIVDVAKKLEQPYRFVHYQTTLLVLQGLVVKVDEGMYMLAPSKKKTAKPTPKGSPPKKDPTKTLSTIILDATRKHCRGEFTSKEVLNACNKEGVSCTTRQRGDALVRLVKSGLLARKEKGVFLLV